jgi:hypothetical protein
MNILRQLILSILISGVPSVFAASAAPPVQVQGIVEEINDVLRTPYIKSASGSGTGPVTFTFDVPDGKRLIIENVSFNVTVPQDVFFRLSLDLLVGSDRQSIYLAPQSSTRGRFDATVASHLGTHPVKLRVDSKAGSNNEIEVFLLRQATDTGSAIVLVTIAGYLVDIPAL